MLRVYQHDPVAYATQHLGVALTPDQEEILRSVRDNRYTAVKASHAIGKTFSAAVACCWWYDCWDAHIAYVTAPTWSQALGLTFKQVKLLRRERRLPGRILETGQVLDDNLTRAPVHFIKALNAESGEGFQGEHSAPILIILEEAVGVPRYIVEAAGGLMTHPACRLLQIGNPTEDANPFGEACESAQYRVLSVSALDHPNITAELAGDPAPFPNAVRLQWLAELLEKECEPVAALTDDAFEWWALEAVKEAAQGRPLPADAPRAFYLPTAYFQGRALGEFPSQADRQVVPKGWLVGLPIHEAEGMPEIGCDVAHFGDDRTTIWCRVGAPILRGREVRKFDTVAVADAVEEDAERLCAEYGVAKRALRIKIDVTGGLGAGPADTLIRRGWFGVVPVNSSETANDDEQYPNRRSELWFDMRDRARERRLDLSRLPRELRERLIRELSAPQYKIQSGRKVVEPKADIKKRLGFSPDLADGFNLCYYAGRPPRRKVRFGRQEAPAAPTLAVPEPEAPATLTLRMLSTRKACLDGLRVTECREGETYTFPEKMGRSFIAQGWAAEAE